MAEILAAVFIFTLLPAPVRGYAAVKQETAADSSVESTKFKLGDFRLAASPVLTKVRMEIFNKGIKEFNGSAAPLAYFGNQTAVGTQHAFICGIRDNSQETPETYAIVSMYEDLKGNVNINKIQDTGIETNISELPGGWTRASSPKVAKSLKKAIKKALKGKSAAALTPVAVLARRQGEGEDYCVLCATAGIDIPSISYEYMVYCHQETDGSVTVSSILNLGSATGKYKFSQISGNTGVDMETASEAWKLFFSMFDYDSLLSRHTSVSQNLWFFEGGSMKSGGSVYFTKDMVYIEGIDYSVMADAGKSYRVSWGEGTDPEKMYVVDLTPDMEEYNTFKYMASSDASDYDDDKVVSFEVTNSMMIITVKCGPESAESIKSGDESGLINDDSEIMSVYTVVAATYDLISSSVYVINDGVPTEVIRNELSYDQPEPLSCTAFRNLFEYTGEQKATVTFVADPDTDHEVTASVTVPLYSTVHFNAGKGIENKLYDDRECTIPHDKKWDKKSDTVIYVRTNRK